MERPAQYPRAGKISDRSALRQYGENLSRQRKAQGGYFDYRIDLIDCDGTKCSLDASGERADDESG
jgi:hypothetical protein